MMSDENSASNSGLFSSDLNSCENVQSLFHNGNIESSLVLNELQICFFKIDTIISDDSTGNIVMNELCQLRQHIVDIIKNVENQIYGPASIEQDIPYEQKQSVRKGQKSNSVEQENLIKNTLEVPKVEGLKEIAGLWEVKKILKSLVVLPRSQPQLFINRKAFNSILLYGPPGTGKTQLVHALAFEANARLHSITVGDILTPLVGQSEKNIQYLFQHLMESSEFTILFIDELDGLCKRRNDSEQEHSRRIKTELMCQISKMEKSFNMFLICATNCPWDLDSAFLRRFQKQIYVPLPGPGERYELFKLFAKHTPLEITNDDWSLLVEKTNGYSGSDLSHIVQYALNIPIFELEETKIWKTCPDGFYEPVSKTEDFNTEQIVCSELKDLPACSVRARNVEPADLINALESVRITVSKDDIKKYCAFQTEQ